MSVPANKETVRKATEELLNEGRLELVDEVWHNDYVFETSCGHISEGRDAQRAFVSEYLAKGKSDKVINEEMIGEGESVAVRQIVSQPDGKSRPRVAIYKFRDGKIVHEWCVCKKEGE